MTFRPRTEQLQHNEAFAALAATGTNLGQSNDDHDLYALMGAMVADLEAGYPPFACRAGCNYCCYHPPLVTSLEWAALYPHLLALAPEAQQSIVAMAELMRPYAPDLAELREQALGADTVRALEAPPMQCPMLVDGRCAIYEARPMVCRGYGYTFRQSDGQRSFYGSYMAFLHLKGNFPRDISLPMYDPFAKRLGELNTKAEGTEAFLPQWLWAHLVDGRLRPSCNLKPDFS